MAGAMTTIDERDDTHPGLELIRNRFYSAIENQGIQCLIPADNQSYHVLCLLLAGPEDKRKPAILGSQATIYRKYDSVRDASTAIFAYKTKHARALATALATLPADWQESIEHLVLFELDTPQVRLGRRLAAQSIRRDMLSPQPHFALKYANWLEEVNSIVTFTEETRFANAVDYLRGKAFQRLGRPANVDANLFRIALSAHEVTATLAESDIVIRTSTTDAGSYSVIGPSWFDLAASQTRLGIDIGALDALVKVRFYRDTQSPVGLVVAPLVFPRVCWNGSPNCQPVQVSPGSAVRGIIETLIAKSSHHELPAHVLLGLYGAARLALEVDLVAAMMRHLEVADDKSILFDEHTSELSYGLGMRPLVELALRSLLSTAPNGPLSKGIVRNGSFQQLPGAATLTLLKATTGKAYESHNFGVEAKPAWSRWGLSFRELIAATGLSETTTSIGLDALSDQGMTEAYNRVSLASDGRYEIDRAFNSKSKEYLARLVVAVRHMTEAVRTRDLPDAVLYTTGMNKLLVLMHYLTGMSSVRVIKNKHGKTLALLADENLQRYDDLGKIVKENNDVVRMTGKGKMFLTPNASNKAWIGEVANAPMVSSAIEISGEMYEFVYRKYNQAKLKGTVRRWSGVEVFSAFTDTVGDKLPEWGLGTPASLVFWAEAERDNEQEWKFLIGDASHKIKIAKDVAVVLASVYQHLCEDRLYSWGKRRLFQTSGVLPQGSPVWALAKAEMTAMRVALETAQPAPTLSLLEIMAGRMLEEERPAEIPAHSFDGVVVYCDVVGTKELIRRGPQWAEKLPLAILARLARDCEAGFWSGTPDGMSIGFASLRQAIMYCGIANVIVDAMLDVVSKALGIDAFLSGGIGVGQVTFTQYAGGWQPTGAGLVNAYEAHRYLHLRGTKLSPEASVMPESRMEAVTHDSVAGCDRIDLEAVVRMRVKELEEPHTGSVR